MEKKSEFILSVTGTVSREGHWFGRSILAAGQGCCSDPGEGLWRLEQV